MSYKKLFEPIVIGDCEIKNRIAMSPMNMDIPDRWDIPVSKV